MVAFARLCRGGADLPDSQCMLRVRGVFGASTPGTSPRFLPSDAATYLCRRIMFVA